ncbi:MAG: dihydropteroate synthase [Candidatus Sifarchaeia archaeon]
MSYSPSVDIRGLMVGPCFPVRVMGVINLSPESFYRGSVADNLDELHEMLENASKQGADIIDIGGASSAPKDIYGTSDISIEEELKRIVKALKSIEVSEYPPLSIDTTSKKVAEAALDLGVSMVNDISGLHADDEMASLVSDRGVPIVLMANCNTPCKNIQASLNSLKDSLTIAKNAGINEEKIILDPGIGFGKPSEVDVAIIRDLSFYVSLNRPLLVGLSRKAFIGHLLNEPNPDNRLTGSIIVSAVAVMNGADVIRTHDISETKLAVKIGETLRKPKEQD